jgi:replicative DNA helicase
MEHDDKKEIQQAITDILENKDTDVQLKDYYESARLSYDTFNTYAYDTGKGYSCPDFPFFDEKMEGLLPGLYLFAARSNCGKTALMTNLMWSYCTNEENHLFGIYYSLDDSRNDVIPRMMSMLQKIPISVCSKPQRYLDTIEELKDKTDDESIQKRETYLEYVDKRNLALQQLKDNNQRFYIVDNQEINSFEKLIEHAKMVQTYVKSIDPKNDIIIGIDSVFDLTFVSKHFHSKDEESREISSRLKRLSEDLEIVIFGSCHLKKSNTKEKTRPIQDDLKDSGRFQYDAQAIFLLHNDVSENKQCAKIYYGTSPDVQPIIEINWSKNKRSSYKGMSYCYFQPDYSYVQECTLEDIRRYNMLLDYLKENNNE